MHLSDLHECIIQIYELQESETEEFFLPLSELSHCHLILIPLYC